MVTGRFVNDLFSWDTHVTDRFFWKRCMIFIGIGDSIGNVVMK